jgi:hypothetical protein
MKPIEEVNACVVEYGSFICLAKRLATRFKTVSYYSPFEQEYRDLRDCCIGDGIQGVKRVNELMDPDFVARTDLWIFPDIGWGGLQRYLRSIGKSVWGSMGASDLELYRTRFYKTIQDYGLKADNVVRIRGLTALSEHLKTVKNKWIKVNRYRENMETWKHRDFDHSARELDRLAIEFGGLKEHVIFVVQDEIPTDIEIGYDGWCIFGEYPPVSYSGYEKKNELYLGSQLPYEELAEPVKIVNEAMAPLWREYGYANFYATELRVLSPTDFRFIDPTTRLAGQTMEHQMKNCENLEEIIYHGAHGEVVTPKFQKPFAVEATLHYTDNSENWKVLRIPPEAEPNVMLYHYCEADGLQHFPPHKTDEVGVCIGLGDTVEGAFDDLKDNLEILENEPVHADLRGFADLLQAIEAAEESGLKFSDKPLPEPAEVVEA